MEAAVEGDEFLGLASKLLIRAFRSWLLNRIFAPCEGSFETTAHTSSSGGGKSDRKYRAGRQLWFALRWTDSVHFAAALARFRQRRFPSLPLQEDPVFGVLRHN